MDKSRFLKLFFILFLVTAFLSNKSVAQNNQIEIARIKYRGGGDWYNDPSSLRNLIQYVNQRFPVKINPNYKDVEIGSPSLKKYPFAFLTGHGIIELNALEVENVRDYLTNGGFLYIDDDYGLDVAVQNLVKRVFPGNQWVEIPFSHPIYNIPYSFPKGVPKVHEHDNKSPQGFAMYNEGRMVLFYTYESNPGDGWADPEIHQDPKEIREKALQFGANLLLFALTQLN